jgi:MoxR-like ATPase
MATQNPVEQEGTYPLPEAQTDRFLFKLIVDYPTAERGIHDDGALGPGHQAARPPVRLQRRGTALAPRRGRPYPRLALRCRATSSRIVRGTRALAAKAEGGTSKRYLNFRRLAPRLARPLPSRPRARLAPRPRLPLTRARPGTSADVLRHRIGLTYEAEAEEITADKIISQVVERTPVPPPGLIFLFPLSLNLSPAPRRVRLGSPTIKMPSSRRHQSAGLVASSPSSANWNGACVTRWKTS